VMAVLSFVGPNVVLTAQSVKRVYQLAGMAFEQ